MTLVWPLRGAMHEDPAAIEIKYGNIRDEGSDSPAAFVFEG